MNHIQLSGKVTLAELQREIDSIEDQLETLPTRYPEPTHWSRFHEEEEFTNEDDSPA